MKRLGHITAAIVADVRFRRKIERLRARGPRAVLEVFAEISAERSIGTVVDQTLDRHLAVSDPALPLSVRREAAHNADPPRHHTH